MMPVSPVDMRVSLMPIAPPVSSNIRSPKMRAGSTEAKYVYAVALNTFVLQDQSDVHIGTRVCRSFQMPPSGLCGDGVSPRSLLTSVGRNRALMFSVVAADVTVGVIAMTEYSSEEGPTAKGSPNRPFRRGGSFGGGGGECRAATSQPRGRGAGDIVFGRPSPTSHASPQTRLRVRSPGVAECAKRWARCWAPTSPNNQTPDPPTLSLQWRRC